MRRSAATVFLILAALLPAAAVASWWAYGQATDTARFDRTARPLAANRTVQDAVVDQLVDAVPAPIQSQVRTLARRATETAAYRAAWRRIQRTAHSGLAARLTGDSDDELTLDLAPAASVLRARATAAGLGPVAAAIRDPTPVTIADPAQIAQARHATDAVKVIRAFSLPLAVLALLGVLLTAPGAGAALLRVAGCLAVSTLLLLAGWAITRSVLSGRGAEGHVAAAVFDVLVRPLRVWAIGGAVLSIDAAAAASLPEPSENPAELSAGPDDTVGGADVGGKLRRAWDLISGKY